MTCVRILLFFIFVLLTSQAAPFVPIDTVHQAYSQFEINLILNENRNHPIILTTVGTNLSKTASIDILENTHRSQPYSSFSILVECDKFNWNLNHSLGVCEYYYSKVIVNKEPANTGSNDLDQFFSCYVFIPSQAKIRQKGHTIMKNHNQQAIPDGKHFNHQYLSEMIKKNIPDFVNYIQDQYELNQFLQYSSQFKSSKQPKLLYFDENLLAPLFLRKLSALMNGKISVAVTDDPPIAKRYNAQFDSLIFLEYSFDKKQYEYRQISFDQYSNPEHTVITQDKISKYLTVKKNRDILLDFQHRDYSIYNFTSVSEVQYLQTHGRAIVIQVSSLHTQFQCEKINQIAEHYNTLFNYVCLDRTLSQSLKFQKQIFSQNVYFILNSFLNGVWVQKNINFMELLPRNSSRQMVSTQSEAELCLRTATITERDPIFFYLQEKTHVNTILTLNYLNSLPEVTSLFYICQIYLPDDRLVKKFSLQINSLFTLKDQDKTGHARKVQHTKIENFLEIKMFLRQIAIEKMIRVYENRLINNILQKIDSSDQLTDKCFNRKCIIGLIATGRYREQQEMKILKELKLEYEQQFKFVIIDGICHWDVPKQLKLLKKKQKVIDRSYVFFYNEKELAYTLWESKKYWNKKDLQRWVKGLRNQRNVNHLKFGIDIEDRVCKKKSESPQLPEEL